MPRKKKSLKRRLIWVTLLLLCIASGGYGWVALQKERPVSVILDEVRERNITSVVAATGRVHPVVEVKISSEVSGEIVELPVREGQRVASGDLLARIRSDTYRAKVRQREAAVSSARSTSLQRKAELLQAEMDLRRTENLHERGFASSSDLENARTRVEVAQASFESSEFQIAQQETQLDEALEELAKTEIYAPMGGTISRLNIELGERVVGTGMNPGTEILTVADLTAMEVRVEVSENEIVQISLGDPARVAVDALRALEFNGRVAEVASSAITIGERQQDAITAFQVRIRLEELDPAIRPGMTASADIQTDTVENALAVPLQAVTVRERSELPGAQAARPDAAASGSENNGGPAGNRRRGRDNLQRVVFVVNDGRVQLRAVETGIADSSHIEIKDGLSAGEQIVSGSYGAITRDLYHDSLVRESESAVVTDRRGR